MIPAVLARIEDVEGHRVIQTILENRGETPDADGVYQTDALTTMEKAELLVDLFFWKMVKEHEVIAAEEQARADAIAAVNEPVDGDV
jgi:hypothetical protein